MHTKKAFLVYKQFPYVSDRKAVKWQLVGWLHNLSLIAIFKLKLPHYILFSVLYTKLIYKKVSIAQWDVK